ncbi:TIGR03960 family B12-binding radical SAM protein [Candidatus Omnitrophota bacterium]
MDERIERNLLKVQKPARYIGGEWNSVCKEWTAGRVKVALCFPDVYEIGMSYLGLKIIYGLLNERDDALCERSFAPWHDMEAVMRAEGIKLYGLESKRPLSEYDIVGFSFAYELNYTNCLNMLDLGGIPKKSAERSDGDPLVIAGGPSCFNPEPMADFIDAFVIGEGEEVINEVVDAYKDSRACGQRRAGRAELLRKLAGIEGVYVPSLYSVSYDEKGALLGFIPKEGAPARIRKRSVADLNSSYYPTKQVVPYIQIVHDRISVEIMRGCKNFCRFCQAGATYRPKRERSREKIIELAKETYRNTGYDEISLISLSSGDHSQIKETMQSLNGEFSGRAVSISFPSLRIENIVDELPFLIAGVKKSGLTFALESGSHRLREMVNKNINIDKLISVVTEAYKAGWKRIKLYFMIGLPTETEADLAEIVKLIERVSLLKKALDGHPAHVHVSISSFIPKPHTPFQWEVMADTEELKKKKAFLISAVRKKRLDAKLDFHDFSRSILEGVFSRGDRRLSGVVLKAWEKGARFDSWAELFNMSFWLDSFADSRLDPADFVYKRKEAKDALPWGFLDTGLNIGPSKRG